MNTEFFLNPDLNDLLTKLNNEIIRLQFKNNELVQQLAYEKQIFIEENTRLKHEIKQLHENMHILYKKLDQ